MTYKAQLLAALISNGWELVQTETQHPEWWCDQYWVVRSVREMWGMELFIFFLVDPQWEGPRKSGQGVWEIAATAQMPSDWLEAARGIATIPMSKRRWDHKLATFISELTDYRREAADPAHAS